MIFSKQVITRYEFSVRPDPDTWPDFMRQQGQREAMFRPVAIRFAVTIWDGKTQWGTASLEGHWIKRDGSPGVMRVLWVHDRSGWDKPQKDAAEKALRDSGLYRSDPLFMPPWI